VHEGLQAKRRVLVAVDDFMEQPSASDIVTTSDPHGIDEHQVPGRDCGHHVEVEQRKTGSDASTRNGG